MQRLLTAAVAVPLALLAVFRLPAPWFFVLVALLIEWGVLEFVRLSRRWAPGAPLAALLLLVPAAALVLTPELLPGCPLLGGHALMGAAVVLSIGLGCLVLVGRTPVTEAMAALGILAFGIPYFALPIASLVHLQRLDPWVLFLLLAIVWLGDTAAFYVGSRYGRHRMAPEVSPKKTWEGAAAGLATGLLAAVVWTVWRFGEMRWGLLAVAAATAVAGQLGDLLESMIKRGAGVKDSGNLLPGHGGVLDRMDAMLFAAPVLLLGLWILGAETMSR
jgi:phosphatidate cytidylyltransferase